MTQEKALYDNFKLLFVPTDTDDNIINIYDSEDENPPPPMVQVLPSPPHHLWNKYHHHHQIWNNKKLRMVQQTRTK